MNLDRVIAVRTNKTVYQDGDKTIKVFDSDYSKADILNEALNQARIEETELDIPKILGVTTLEGKWAIVSEFIKGKTLDQLMFENPSKYYDYLEEFVRLQIKVHNTKAPLVGKLKDKMHRKIDQADLDPTISYELHTRLAGMPTHEKVCHGDFNPSNIIIREEDGKPFIIDWSHVTQGNASADVARTYLLFWLDGDISGADDYLDMYCKLSGTDKRYIQRWLPIVAASQSVKGKKEEREFLLSWVNVVEFE